MGQNEEFGSQTGDFRDSGVDLVRSELMDRGHLAIDMVVEWFKGEKQVSLARVILADEARKDSFQEPS